MQIDLLFDYEVEEAAQAFQEVSSVETVIPVAAAKGRNVKAVEEWAVSHLPLGPALYPKVQPDCAGLSLVYGQVTTSPLSRALFHGRQMAYHGRGDVSVPRRFPQCLIIV